MKKKKKGPIIFFFFISTLIQRKKKVEKSPNNERKKEREHFDSICSQKVAKMKTRVVCGFLRGKQQKCRDSTSWILDLHFFFSYMSLKFHLSLRSLLHEAKSNKFPAHPTG